MSGACIFVSKIKAYLTADNLLAAFLLSNAYKKKKGYEKENTQEVSKI